MRCLLSIALLSIGALSAHAQDTTENMKAKAQAALALSHAQRMRDAKEALTGPGDAAKAKVALLLASAQRARSEKDGCMSDLGAAIARAEKEKRHLFVWVGMTCDKTIRKEFSNGVHCHVDTLNGSAAPRLIVGSEQPNLRLMKSELDKAAPKIRQFLAPAKKLSSVAPPIVVQSC